MELKGMQILVLQQLDILKKRQLIFKTKKIKQLLKM